MSESGYYIEYVSIGGQVKVTALDPETGIEVSIIAPKTASQTDMNRIAVDKLIKRIAREGRETASDKQKKTGGRGIIV